MGDWAAAEAKAQGQRGVITLGQLQELGIRRPALKWALSSKRLVRMFFGVYRFPVVSPTWQQRALGATLLLGEGSALSHATAASMWGLNGFDAGSAAALHLSVAGRRCARLPEGLVLHRPTTAFDVYRQQGLPVTYLARTVVDIAPLVSDERLEMILDGAQHRYRAFPRWMDRELSLHHPQSRPGLRRLMELLAFRQGTATESPLETRVRRRIREFGLLPPRPQVAIYDREGFVMRVDFAWLELRVALHVDGFAWHASRLPFDRDAAQRSRLAALGWVSIVVTQRSLEDTAWLHQLAMALHQRAPQTELFGAAW